MYIGEHLYVFRHICMCALDFTYAYMHLFSFLFFNAQVHLCSPTVTRALRICQLCIQMDSSVESCASTAVTITSQP